MRFPTLQAVVCSYKMVKAKRDSWWVTPGFAIIKVRFSDQVEIEMEFKPLEPVTALYEFLQKCVCKATLQ